MSPWSVAAAYISGVMPRDSFALTFAPASRSVLTTEAGPYADARISGVNRPRSIVPFFTCCRGRRRLGVHVGARRKQQLHRLEVAVRCRIHQRSGTGDVRLVDRCAGLEQQTHGFGVVAVGGCEERRRLFAIERLRVGAALEEKASRLGGSIAHRREQQRGPAALGCRLHVGAAFDQEPDLRRIRGRPHQRRRAGGAAGIDVGAVIEQQPHRVERSERGRVHQRGDATTPIDKVTRQGSRPAAPGDADRCRVPRHTIGPR